MAEKSGSGWAIWIVVAIVIILAFLFVFSLSRNSATVGGSLVDPVSAQDHIRGNRQAKAVLVEYGDFQCPACGVYEPVVEQLSKDFSEQQLAVVFRNFPLNTLHAHAQIAAQAAEAANLQGWYWQMHDYLYAHQSEWEKAADIDNLLARYAQELGLDQQKFFADLQSSAVKDRVDADYASGLRSGVQGTPTFFLNGKMIANPNGYDAFKAVIQAALNLQ